MTQCRLVLIYLSLIVDFSFSLMIRPGGGLLVRESLDGEPNNILFEEQREAAVGFYNGEPLRGSGSPGEQSMSALNMHRAGPLEKYRLYASGDDENGRVPIRDSNYREKGYSTGETHPFNSRQISDESDRNNVIKFHAPNNNFDEFFSSNVGTESAPLGSAEIAPIANGDLSNEERVYDGVSLEIPAKSDMEIDESLRRLLLQKNIVIKSDGYLERDGNYLNEGQNVPDLGDAKRVFIPAGILEGETKRGSTFEEIKSQIMSDLAEGNGQQFDSNHESGLHKGLDHQLEFNLLPWQQPSQLRQQEKEQLFQPEQPVTKGKTLNKRLLLFRQPFFDQKAFYRQQQRLTNSYKSQQQQQKQQQQKQQQQLKQQRLKQQQQQQQQVHTQQLLPHQLLQKWRQHDQLNSDAHLHTQLNNQEPVVDKESIEERHSRQPVEQLHSPLLLMVEENGRQFGPVTRGKRQGLALGHQSYHTKPLGRHQLFVQQGCSPSESDGYERFACPSDSSVCIDDHQMCNKVKDCPGEEDESSITCLLHDWAARHFKSTDGQLWKIVQQL